MRHILSTPKRWWCCVHSVHTDNTTFWVQSAIRTTCWGSNNHLVFATQHGWSTMGTTLNPTPKYAKRRHQRCCIIALFKCLFPHLLYIMLLSMFIYRVFLDIDPWYSLVFILFLMFFCDCYLVSQFIEVNPNWPLFLVFILILENIPLNLTGLFVIPVIPLCIEKPKSTQILHPLTHSIQLNLLINPVHRTFTLILIQTLTLTQTT